MADSLNIPIATIDKNTGSEVRVALTTFRGSQLVDLRTYVAFTAAKVPMATKRGISLRAEHLPAIIAALKEAQARATELGWIGGGA